MAIWGSKIALMFLTGFELVTGKFFWPSCVNFLLFRSGQVSRLWFGFGKLPLKVQNFPFFSLWIKKISSGWTKSTQVKGRLAFYLLLIKSMLGSGQGPISSLNPRPSNSLTRAIAIRPWQHQFDTVDLVLNTNYYKNRPQSYYG